MNCKNCGKALIKIKENARFVLWACDNVMCRLFRERQHIEEKGTKANNLLEEIKETCEQLRREELVLIEADLREGSSLVSGSIKKHVLIDKIMSYTKTYGVSELTYLRDRAEAHLRVLNAMRQERERRKLEHVS